MTPESILLTAQLPSIRCPSRWSSHPALPGSWLYRWSPSRPLTLTGKLHSPCKDPGDPAGCSDHSTLSALCPDTGVTFQEGGGGPGMGGGGRGCLQGAKKPRGPGWTQSAPRPVWFSLWSVSQADLPGWTPPVSGPILTSLSPDIQKGWFPT